VVRSLIGARLVLYYRRMPLIGRHLPQVLLREVYRATCVTGVTLRQYDQCGPAIAVGNEQHLVGNQLVAVDVHRHQLRCKPDLLSTATPTCET
jgi:hypothetical protein